MAENKEDQLIAAALQIAKSLGPKDPRKDDILKIFGGKLREKLAHEEFSGGSAGPLQTINSIGRQITRFVSLEHSIWSNPLDSSSFLDVIDHLIDVIRDWNSFADDPNIASYLGRANQLLQQSMFRLEDEFKRIVERGSQSTHRNPEYATSEGDEDEENGVPVAQPIKDYNIVIDLLPAGITKDLNEIASRMVVAEFGKECSVAYSSWRKEFLDESLSRLGIRKLGVDELKKMPWNQMENEIEIWGKAIAVSLRILFPSERSLCDHVFHGFSSAASLSFMDSCRDSTVHLLNFADAVATGSRAPDRLFKVLDVYETMRDLIPEFESIFSDKYGLSLWNEYVTIWKRLRELIREMFMELENLVRDDSSKTAFPGGGVHPMARYVINYLLAVSKEWKTVEHVFEESSGYVDDRSGSGKRALPSSSSPLAVQVKWIMKLLVSNLEAKSKLHDDFVLCSLFMMNNESYISQKVKGNELGMLLGDEWIRNQGMKVRQNLVNYQRNSWGKVLDVLKVDNTSQPPNEAFNSMKEKLRSFNLWFEAILTTQSSWVFFDDLLREELRSSISDSLSRAYRSFIGRYQSVAGGGIQQDKIIRFNTEDIENRINELFQNCDKGRR